MASRADVLGAAAVHNGTDQIGCLLSLRGVGLAWRRAVRVVGLVGPELGERIGGGEVGSWWHGCAGNVEQSVACSVLADLGAAIWDRVCVVCGLWAGRLGKVGPRGVCLRSGKTINMLLVCVVQHFEWQFKGTAGGGCHGRGCETNLGTSWATTNPHGV